MFNTNIPNESLDVNSPSVAPSGISHAFDTGYAIAYGVDEAIMIRNLQFFITTNASRGHNLREGRFWTYDRLEDFLNHFPYWSVQTVRRVIASLISQEVIIKGEFNEKWSNRTQWYAFKDQDKFIKNIKTPKTPSPTPPADLPKSATEASDLLKPTSDRISNQQLADVEIHNCNIGTSTVSSAISSYSSLKVSNETKEADASGELKVEPIKLKKEKPVFSEKVRDTGNQILNLLSKNCPVYRPPEDLTKFLGRVQDLIEKDKQDLETVLQTFEWAVSDNEKRGDFNGWQGIIATNSVRGRTTNPADRFHKHLTKIHSDMNARAKRKFAPSSNDNEAFEKMKEMSARAI